MLKNVIQGAVLAVAMSVAGGAMAAPLFFDNFEGEVAALNTTLDNFTVNSGVVDVVQSGTFGITCDGKCVDLDGSMSLAADIHSTGGFLSGNLLLSFDMSGNQRGGADDTVNVYFGAVLLDTITLASSDPFSTFSYSIVGQGLGNIRFEHLGGDNIGILLDNVAINVPEPATLGLLGMGLLGLGGAIRSRRKIAVAA